jgi:NAD(P)-dependent dehydrogenase (short-subunit alcohol dehydrogenase family)
MSDLFSLDGKHVLVTGGSSGLGRFFAVFLAANGAQVTVAARRAEALAKTVDDIGTANGRAQSVVTLQKGASVLSTSSSTTPA